MFVGVAGSGHCTDMTEEGIGKNFRSAYYETLGFRENEKSISQLENQLKADVIGL